jgi:O-antigen ligase
VVAVVARDFPNSLVGGVRFLELFCLVPMAVMISLRTLTDAKIVLGSLLGLAVLEGVVGIVQTLTGTGADIGGQAIRAVGTFGAYNIGSLGDLSGLGMVVCLALGVVLSGRARWWALATAAFLVLPLAFSLGRGVWVAAAVAAVLTASRGRVARLLVIGAVVTVLGAAALPVLTSGSGDLSGRLTSLVDVGSEPDQSVIDRLALWKAAERMAYDHPLTGVGPRAFPDHRDAYADLSLLGSSDIAQGGDFQRVALDSPHDFYLLVASEQGLVAAALYGLVFLVLLARGFVRAARPRSDVSTALALAGTGALVYELVGMISADLGGPGSILVAIAVGLAGWGAADLRLAGSDREQARPARDRGAAEPPRDVDEGRRAVPLAVGAEEGR